MSYHRPSQILPTTGSLATMVTPKSRTFTCTIMTVWCREGEKVGWYGGHISELIYKIRRWCYLFLLEGLWWNDWKENQVWNLMEGCSVLEGTHPSHPSSRFLILSPNHPPPDVRPMGPHIMTLFKEIIMVYHQQVFHIIQLTTIIDEGTNIALCPKEKKQSSKPPGGTKDYFREN